MLAKAGGCYRSEFKGARDVTQGDPLPPTVFNVVVDEVVWHWVIVVVDSMKYQGGHGQEGRHQNAFFYTDNGMVAS